MLAQVSGRMFSLRTCILGTSNGKTASICDKLVDKCAGMVRRTTQIFLR